MATYSTADLLRGEEFHLYVNVTGSTYEPIAFGTSATLSMSSDQIDCSSKFSGVWSEALAGRLSYTVSCENLMTYSGGTGYDYLYEKFVAREPMLFKFAQCADLADADFAINESKTYWSGSAWITSLSLNTESGAVASVSIELTGDGALTMTKATA